MAEVAASAGLRRHQLRKALEPADVAGLDRLAADAIA